MMFWSRLLCKMSRTSVEKLCLPNYLKSTWNWTKTNACTIRHSWKFNYSTRMFTWSARQLQNYMTSLLKICALLLAWRIVSNVLCPIWRLLWSLLMISLQIMLSSYGAFLKVKLFAKRKPCLPSKVFCCHFFDAKLTTVLNCDVSSYSVGQCTHAGAW